MSLHNYYVISLHVTTCVTMVSTTYAVYNTHCIDRYTFGEPVIGMVTLNFTLEASGRRESLMFKQVVASLVSTE